MYILKLVWPILVRRRERVRDLLYCHLFWRSAGKKICRLFYAKSRMLKESRTCKPYTKHQPPSTPKLHESPDAMAMWAPNMTENAGLLQLCWLVIVNPSEMTRRTNIFNVISNYDTHVHTWMQKKTLLPVHSTCASLYNCFFL